MHQILHLYTSHRRRRHLLRPNPNLTTYTKIRRRRSQTVSRSHLQHKILLIHNNFRGSINLKTVIHNHRTQIFKPWRKTTIPNSKLQIFNHERKHPNKISSSPHHSKLTHNKTFRIIINSNSSLRIEITVVREILDRVVHLQMRQREHVISVFGPDIFAKNAPTRRAAAVVCGYVKTVFLLTIQL